MKAKGLGGLGIVLLSVTSLAAASSDLRLIEAVKKGDKAAIRSLVKQRADVNAAEADGATALTWATDQGDLEAADLLIRAGANVNVANEYGVTPLWLASDHGNSAIVETLLKAGANPNTALPSGETPLMAAANRGSIDAIKLLLAKGADVNTKGTGNAQTALMWAAAGRHSEAVGVLLEAGADIKARSRGNFTPLLFAAQQGDLASARLLVAAGADVNEVGPNDMTPLLLATASRVDSSGSLRNGIQLFGNQDSDYNGVVAFLLEKGANPSAVDSRGFTALHSVAAGHNMLPSVKALLAHGANPNAQLTKDVPTPFGIVSKFPIGATPFLLAAAAGNADVMRVLVANGADPLKPATKYGHTPLQMASGGGEGQNDFLDFTEERKRRALEAATLAVELGADVTQANEAGQTPLHYAAYMGLDSIVQFLVDKGAKLDVIDHFGMTPLTISKSVLTVGVGARFDAAPRTPHASTEALLLKLGATPIELSGVQLLDVSNSKIFEITLPKSRVPTPEK